MGRPRQTQLPDEELLDRAKRGDLSAYEEIVRRYQAPAFRLAWVLCGSTEDAQEAAQDAFVKAHRALGGFRAGAPLRPWLLKIVANEARNRRSSRVRRAALELRLAREAPSGEAAPSPEGTALAEGEREELLARVRGLPERHRQVILCRYLLGLSEAETAAALACRPGTVKSRLARALARLRAELEAGGPDG